MEIQSLMLNENVLVFSIYVDAKKFLGADWGEAQNGKEHAIELHTPFHVLNAEESVVTIALNGIEHGINNLPNTFNWNAKVEKKEVIGNDGQTKKLKIYFSTDLKGGGNVVLKSFSISGMVKGHAIPLTKSTQITVEKVVD